MKFKKGSDKVISVYWFLILTIIAGGIVAMVHVFYNSSYDVREVESEILAMKVANCISIGGKMNPSLDGGKTLRAEFRDNFRKHCTLNFDPPREFEPEQYYVQVDFYSLSDKDTPYYTISEGNSNWVQDCGVESENKKFVRCSSKEFFVSSKEGEVYRVSILAAVRNTEKNVA